MTSMEQIELISVEARKRGMKYGEYVAKYGHTLPKVEEEKQEKKVLLAGRKDKAHNRRIDMVCAECGVTFSAGRKDAKYCPKCAKIRRQNWARENKKRREQSDAESSDIVRQ